jgi:hypothetical protein
MLRLARAFSWDSGPQRVQFARCVKTHKLRATEEDSMRRLLLNAMLLLGVFTLAGIAAQPLAAG